MLLNDVTCIRSKVLAVNSDLRMIFRGLFFLFPRYYKKKLGQ